MYSAYKLNKQGDNIQPWYTPFPIWNQSVVPCPVLTVASWPAYRFLKRQIRWSGIPMSFRIFHSSLQFPAIFQTQDFTSLLAIGWMLPSPGQTPIWGLLHGTSHNKVASFFKTTKGESPCKMCNRILCILITETTIHSLCHLLVKSHRFHLCSRRGNYTRVWMSGSRDHGALRVCLPLGLILLSIVSAGSLMWSRFNFEVFALLSYLMKLFRGIDRRNLPLGKTELCFYQ